MRTFLLTIAITTLLGNVAHAGATVRIDETRSITVAIAARSSFSTTDNAAPDGKSRSWDPVLEGGVLAMSGVVDKRFRVAVNLARTATGEVRVMDGILQLEPSEKFKVWGGRLLPASDRASLTGPFFSSTWEVPFVSVYPSAFLGRDDGAAAWGHLVSSRVKYQGGLFRGRDGGTNTADDPLYAGRLTVNLLDPEPGYYNNGTYLGARKILAFGGGVRMQRNGAGTPPNPTTGAPGETGNFFAWNADVLLEHPLGPLGTGTLEGAFYRYDLERVADPALVEGDGFYALAGWLLPWTIGQARFQPTARWQSLDAIGGPHRTRWDACLNVLLNGHFTKLGLIFSGEDRGLGAGEIRSVKVGAQIVL